MFEQYESELQEFCDSLNVESIEDLRPYWCAGVKSSLSINSWKFLAICSIIASAKIFENYLDDEPKKYKDFISNSEDMEDFKSYLCLAKNHGKISTPFFDSGYTGICWKNIHGEKFLVMINEGCVGLEDQYDAYVTVGNKKISLVHDGRAFGDPGMHEQDNERNIELISNAIVKEFYK